MRSLELPAGSLGAGEDVSLGHTHLLLLDAQQCGQYRPACARSKLHQRHGTSGATDACRPPCCQDARLARYLLYSHIYRQPHSSHRVDRGWCPCRHHHIASSCPQRLAGLSHITRHGNLRPTVPRLARASVRFARHTVPLDPLAQTVRDPLQWIRPSVSFPLISQPSALQRTPYRLDQVHRPRQVLQGQHSDIQPRPVHMAFSGDGVDPADERYLESGWEQRRWLLRRALRFLLCSRYA